MEGKCVILRAMKYYSGLLGGYDNSLSSSLFIYCSYYYPNKITKKLIQSAEVNAKFYKD